MSPTVIAVITARMGSERLPGKVMLPLAGKPVVAHMVERLDRVEGIDGIWLATSGNPENKPLIEYARSLGIEVYAGSEEDVVGRHVAIAERTGAAHLLRATGDCPLFDIGLASRMVAHHVAADADFTYVPALLSLGILTEMISASAMQRVHEVYQGEHITLSIKERPEAFRIEPLDVHAALEERLYRPDFRLTLDEPADYEVLKAVYEALYQDGNPLELVRVTEFLESHPEIARLNADVEQKSGNLYAQELDARVLAHTGLRIPIAEAPPGTCGARGSKLR